MAAAWVVAAARTPIGRFGGGLRDVSAVELGRVAAAAALARSGRDPGAVDVVVFGQARQAGSGPNPARQIAMGAGVGHEAPAYTVNQACGSSLLAIRQGMDEIARHGRSLALVGGVESMSGLPYYLERARWGYRLGNGELVDANYRDGFFCPLADQLMGRTAETLASQHSISRARQEEYAMESHHRAAATRAAGGFGEEIAPVDARQGEVGEDEAIREQVDPAKLAKLPLVFLQEEDGGTVTAGTSSAITDGGAALVLAGGKEPPPGALARLVGYAVAGVPPEVMGIGPVPACAALARATGWRADEVEHVELNEAFAAQVLACNDELGIDEARLNPRGGAIALGHPIGCTGARMVVTMVHALRAAGGGRGIATLCISGGMGMALAVEVLAP